MLNPRGLEGIGGDLEGKGGEEGKELRIKELGQSGGLTPWLPHGLCEMWQV